MSEQNQRKRNYSDLEDNSNQRPNRQNSKNFNNRNRSRNRNPSHNPNKKHKKNQSYVTFANFKIKNSLVRSLKAISIYKPTPVQRKCLPILLSGKNATISSKTGSGKTLCFLLPAIQLLTRLRSEPSQGTIALIISPTRELATQIYKVSWSLLRFEKQRCGLIIGGQNKQKERHHLINGSNLLIATPGRLLYHLNETKGFMIRNLKYIALDEADKLIEKGLEPELDKIFTIINRRIANNLNIQKIEKSKKKENKKVKINHLTNLQIVLTSATQDDQIRGLYKHLGGNLNDRFALKYIGVDDESQSATVKTLEQGYIICKSDQRLIFLINFLKRFSTSKIIIFFSSVKSANFHSRLLDFLEFPTIELHGQMEQRDRTFNLENFHRAKVSVLITTDVAARGIDFAEIDWIIQYDPPDDPNEYIHRVGRTARAGKSGKALLFLRPEEKPFLKFLTKSKVSLSQFEINEEKIKTDIQEKLEKIIEIDKTLKKFAIEAYKGYVISYTSHTLKECFDLHQLDLRKVAKSFCFKKPPKISFGFNVKKGNRKKRKRKLNNKY
ncbi:atp-dependent RNA helicase ddx18 [Anaeramoeba flamelloides]|uniref:ATP-dependent RNA helicase n=1 Tax=Anaeramoeba flamelloides TaxID=1746091 RepID=A0AAV7ZSC8_9EUKA|nr:atp-dependent RNA helicase ddx18 [Anaeramoeba flamelloides]